MKSRRAAAQADAAAASAEAEEAEETPEVAASEANVDNNEQDDHRRSLTTSSHEFEFNYGADKKARQTRTLREELRAWLASPGIQSRIQYLAKFHVALSDDCEESEEVGNKDS